MTRPRINTKQKIGLVLCGLYSLGNIPSFLGSTDEGDGPPLGILVIGSILGVIGLVATVMAWRGHRVALRVAAGAIIVVTLTGLPAFFVDVPVFVKALVGVSVLLTLAAVVLMFSSDRRSATVTD
ncbi:MAG TPA: hypothetical protein VNQ53_07685 [Nocardioides sp.]|nr:hypothetical protein [Nocardioides sp.]